MNFIRIFAFKDFLSFIWNLSYFLNWHSNEIDLIWQDSIRDKLSPIFLSANYTYEERPNGISASGQLEPALDSTVPLAFITEVGLFIKLQLILIFIIFIQGRKRNVVDEEIMARTVGNK